MEIIAFFVIIGIILFIAFFVSLYKDEQQKAEELDSCKGHLRDKKREVEKLTTELRNTKQRLLQKEKECVELASENRVIREKYKTMFSEADKIISLKFNSYAYLAGLVSDFHTLHYDSVAYLLEHKERPARVEAMRIRELKEETRQILQEKKELEYKLAYIQTMFPNIDDIFDSGFNEEKEVRIESEENTDRVSLLLSYDEYQKLSVSERNQLALDRYVERQKSNWQIGRDYEMYIGFQYEKRGFDVQYTGIIKNFEDMGRDLIVTSGEKVYIIQCKRWSKEKTIHEKHIFQLFGTVMLYNLDHFKHPAKGVFVSTTKLSAKAQAIADQLDIQVVYQEQGDFPRIKCNINQRTGEKIYHLPFDQQYDSAVIESEKGEMYAFTVKEAESKGFRRAMKHFAS